VGGRALHLRPREWAVLACLSARAGEVVLKKALLAEVFTFDDEVAPNALEVHVGRLRRQLEPDGPAIKTMRGLGYMLVAA
jgi:two-component system response regulator TctD